MRFAMELLVSRSYPLIDCDSLVAHQARDSLFRIADGSFLLHLSGPSKTTGWFGSIAAQRCFGSMRRRTSLERNGNSRLGSRPQHFARSEACGKRGAVS
jgi:hypothetical protein